MQYQDQNQSRTLSYNKATYILEIFGSNSTTNKQSHFVQGHAQKENLGVGFLFGGFPLNLHIFLHFKAILTWEGVWTWKHVHAIVNSPGREISSGRWTETRDPLSSSAECLLHELSFGARVNPPEGAFSRFLLWPRNFHKETVQGKVVPYGILQSNPSSC